MKKIPNYLYVLFFAIILMTGCSISQDNTGNEPANQPLLSQEAREYLATNSMLLDISDNLDFSTFSMILSHLQEHDVFLIGEQHATKKNSEMKLKFLKFFQKVAGIRYYLAESGYGCTSLVNTYLRTGNEDYIRKRMNTLRGTASCSFETFEFWQKVREFNLSLPEQERIILIGIDIEHQLDAAIFALYLLLPPSSPNSPPYIDDIREFYTEMNNGDFKRENYYPRIYDGIETLMNNLANELAINENIYQDYLNTNLFDFKLIVENCLNHFLFYDNNSDSEQNRRLREEAMYSNFLKAYHHLQGGVNRRFFGQFGGYHVYLQSRDNNKRLATMMQHKNDSPVNGKTLSIKTFYVDSYYLDRGSQQAAPITYQTNYANELVNLASGDEVLFALTGENSPFERETFFISDEVKNQNYPTTDYFQFCILLVNSEANRPWE